MIGVDGDDVRVCVCMCVVWVCGCGVCVLWCVCMCGCGYGWVWVNLYLMVCVCVRACVLYVCVREIDYICATDAPDAVDVTVMRFPPCILLCKPWCVCVCVCVHGISLFYFISRVILRMVFRRSGPPGGLEKSLTQESARICDP